MIEQKTINGVSALVAILNTATHDIRAAYKLGATVKDLGEDAGADLAVNFNYANDDTGEPIGRLIVDSKTVVSDIAKTIPRDELYMLSDGTLHIGKAPTGTVWSVEGSPPLLKDGKAVWKEGIVRDDLGRDIWTRDAYRTAVGLRSDRELVIVRTRVTTSLATLAGVMLALGCVDALNGDGGGSSYLFPADGGYRRKLGSALTAKQKETAPISKLIALCDGHGMETAGKRTPQGIADTETGANFMHENEFNRAVVAKMDEHLRRCGLRTLLVAPGDSDVSLQARTDKANAAKADLYVSVHANAIGAGEWNSVRGIETFHSPGSVNGQKAATVLHRNLIAGTKLPDRGVKTADFHVLRETHMPAVLVECGFMTSREDAALLLSGAYRSECAEELARGICEYFGVPYVATTPAPAPKTETVKAIAVDVMVDETNLGKSLIIDGVTYVPARKLSDHFDWSIQLPQNGIVKINTKKE